MAKGLNKHTPDSDELLKRLNSNDSSGLDDFEKEALEGFDSLDNAELAKNLTDSLNKKIDEKYFQEVSGGKKKRPLYLSLAAGLVLVVGLSIFFMNIMGDKKEMAMENAPSPENIANEVSKPNDLSPPPPPAELEEAPKTEGKSAAGGDVPVTTIDALAKAEEKFVSGKDAPTDTREQQPDKDDGLTSRMVIKEKKTETAKEPFKAADAESGDDLKNIESDKVSKGPPAGNNSPTTPMVVEDRKAKPVQTSPSSKAQEEESNEKVILSNNNNNVVRNDAKGGKDANKQSPEKKARAKDKSGEALGKEDAPVTLDESTVYQTTINQNATVGGVATGTKRDESGYVHNVEFSNHAYNKPQDYIKVEINKSEMLKTNVKAFKAELTINEKGTVTAVKFLTPFANCVGCQKELEKILLNMPGWKPKTKTVVETVSYIDQ